MTDRTDKPFGDDVQQTGHPVFGHANEDASSNRVQEAACGCRLDGETFTPCDSYQDAIPNSVADYPEDLRWRQHVEDEIVCLQEAVADLQRRMAT